MADVRAIITIDDKEAITSAIHDIISDLWKMREY